MNPKLRTCFLFVCSLLLAMSCASDKAVFERSATKYRIGDQEGWAAKELDQRSWHRRPSFVPDGKIFWSRTKVKILQAPEAMEPYGVRMEIYGEYEVFWDGELIGRNGNPGQEAELPPKGELWTTFTIPLHLTDVGEHVLALRLSNYYYPDHIGVYELEVDYYDDLMTDRLIQNAYMHVFAGAFLVASIYCLFLFLGNKKEYLLLIFSISSFFFFGLTMTHFVRTTLPIHYSLHVLRLEVITGLLFGISFLIPLYFSMQFPFPRRKLFVGLYAVILLFMFSSKHNAFDYTILKMTAGLCVFSLGITIFAVYKRAKGALLVLLTLLLCIFIGYTVSFNLALFIGFSLILFNMLYLLSVRVKEQRLAYETSLVQSTRLKLELVKKNIQPHFLMNTLTSLMDWVEEAPDKGVLFIEALAREFDLINQMEDQTLIPISQEIALCRTHLEIMKYRKEIDYSWEEEGIDPEQKVPPAIFHTLLENGITHSMPGEDNSIRFRLTYESNSNHHCYTFLTMAAGVKQGKSREEGTGLKYIKARLTESYDAKWDLSSEPTPEGWRNVIKIYY